MLKFVLNSSPTSSSLPNEIATENDKLKEKYKLYEGGDNLPQLQNYNKGTLFKAGEDNQLSSNVTNSKIRVSHIKKLKGMGYTRIYAAGPGAKLETIEETGPALSK